MTEQRSLKEVIGQSVRRIREERRWRQADLSRVARDHGLDMSESAVAGLEAGRRELNVGEFTLLAMALQVPPADLLAGDGEEMVQLTEGAALSLGGVCEVLGAYDALPELTMGDVDLPKSRNFNWRDWAARVGQSLDQFEAVAPGITYTRAAQAEQAVGDTERKAANRLGTTPVLVSVAAFGRYGCSLADERDARVEESAPDDATDRTLQALRGHVTRELLDELRPMVEKASRRRRKR